MEGNQSRKSTDLCWLNALLPVMLEDIPGDAEILRSFIFLVEKFLANGESWQSQIENSSEWCTTKQSFVPK